MVIIDLNKKICFWDVFGLGGIWSSTPFKVLCGLAVLGLIGYIISSDPAEWIPILAFFLVVGLALCFARWLARARRKAKVSPAR